MFSLINWHVLRIAAIIGSTFGPFSPAYADPPQGGKSCSSDVEPQAVIDALQRIIDGRGKADKKTANLLVKGKVSTVGVGWKPGMSKQTIESMPPPDWQEFVLIQRGAKRRYEQDYSETGDAGSSKTRVYRLSDGESFFKLDGSALEILGNKSDRDRWEGFAYDYYTYGQIHDGRQYVPLVSGCNTLIDGIQSTDEKGYWQRRVVKCSEEQGLLLVDNDDRVVKSGNRYRFRFWVDPAKGYRVVKIINEQGGEGGPNDFHEYSIVGLKEIIPGAFIETKGSYFVENVGTAAKKGDRAGWLKREMEVSEVRVEDFSAPDELFDWKSLPIPVGTLVTDHRKDPPLEFNHGKEPLDEEVLRESLRATAKSSWWLSRRVWIVTLTSILLIIYIGALFMRKQKRNNLHDRAVDHPA